VHSRTEKCRKLTGGYGYVPTALQDLEATRHALRCLEAVDELPRADCTTASWVLSHLIEGAAFAWRPRQRPSVGATYTAMDSLRAMGTLPPTEVSEVIGRWLADRQGSTGGFSDSERERRSILEATYEALAVLALVNRVEVVDKAAAAAFVTGEWVRTPRMPKDTVFAARALSALGKLDAPIVQQLRIWVRSTKPWMLRLRVDRHPGVINAFLDVAELVLDQSGEELAEIKAILALRTRTALEEPNWLRRPAR
jgi:hypothetical protein